MLPNPSGLNAHYQLDVLAALTAASLDRPGNRDFRQCPGARGRPFASVQTVQSPWVNQTQRPSIQPQDASKRRYRESHVPSTQSNGQLRHSLPHPVTTQSPSRAHAPPRPNPRRRSYATTVLAIVAPDLARASRRPYGMGAQSLPVASQRGSGISMPISMGTRKPGKLRCTFFSMASATASRGEEHAKTPTVRCARAGRMWR